MEHMHLLKILGFYIVVNKMKRDPWKTILLNGKKCDK